MIKTQDWGILPGEVRETILRREWGNLNNLKSRLLGKKPFPIKIPLKPPTGNAAVNDIGHYQNFVKSWREYPNQDQVNWEERSYRSLLAQEVPCSFQIDNFKALIEYVGEDAIKRSEHWKKIMTPIMAMDRDLYPILISKLATIEKLDEWDSEAITSVAQQLKQGMGEGILQLRELPLTGVHTKFLESHKTLLAAIVDHLNDGSVTEAGGLISWLECLEAPRNWLFVRPLCDGVKKRIGGHSELRLTADQLRSEPLPAKNILIVENVQTGFGLPKLKDTITVFGGGKNTSWTDAAWLKGKNVAYWGDMDTWGLSFLSDVRESCPNVQALMMDMDTYHRFKRFSTLEKPEGRRPNALTEDENALYDLLINADPKLSIRLEQEYLSADYIKDSLEKWLSKDSLRNRIHQKLFG